MTDERKYKLGETFEPQGDDEHCSSCDTQIATLQVYDYPYGHHIAQTVDNYSDRDRLYTIEEILTFCEFCASTHCSRSVSYPGHVDHDAAATMGAIAFSHNAIMAELRKPKPGHVLVREDGLFDIISSLSRVDEKTDPRQIAMVTVEELKALIEDARTANRAEGEICQKTHGSSAGFCTCEACRKPMS